MKVYITRFCLTEGIREEEARIKGDLAVAETGSYRPLDWYASHEEAQARAMRMRDKRIRALEAQISELRSLSFVGRETS